jgi:hypothetical protein
VCNKQRVMSDLLVDHERAKGLPEAIRKGLRHKKSTFQDGADRGDPAACVKLYFSFGLYKLNLGGDAGPCAAAASWAPLARAAGGVLEEVDFTGTKGTSAAVLRALAAACGGPGGLLRVVNLTRAKDTTAEGVAALLDGCPGLEALDLRGTGVGLTRAFVARYPKVKITGHQLDHDSAEGRAD